MLDTSGREWNSIHRMPPPWQIGRSRGVTNLPVESHPEHRAKLARPEPTFPGRERRYGTRLDVGQTTTRELRFRVRLPRQPAHNVLVSFPEYRWPSRAQRTIECLQHLPTGSETTRARHRRRLQPFQRDVLGTSSYLLGVVMPYFLARARNATRAGFVRPASTSARPSRMASIVS